MRTFYLKFPSKSVAIPLLYTFNESGNVQRLYQMFDGSDYGQGEGIATERFTNADGGDGLCLPSDGSFCVDILADELPSELTPFEIFPDVKYRKHKFFGEE